MHIFNSSVGDPMLLESFDGLRMLYSSFDTFLVSDEVQTSFRAVTQGNPAPYDEFLQGLRVRKGGEAELNISMDGWLELSGTVQELESFKECFLIDDDGSHRHWYSVPISLIIERSDICFHG